MASRWERNKVKGDTDPANEGVKHLITCGTLSASTFFV